MKKNQLLFILGKCFYLFIAIYIEVIEQLIGLNYISKRHLNFLFKYKP